MADLYIDDRAVRFMDALIPLRRALKKLHPDQGRTARRNARRAVKRELAKITQWMDRQFPLPKRPRKPASRRGKSWRLLTGWDRDNRLRNLGYVPQKLTNVEMQLACNRAGIQSRYEYCGVMGMATWWIPKWAADIGPDAKQLRAAKKSWRTRRVLLAQKALSTPKV